MESIPNNHPSDDMIYPFGFGFALMENEGAMAYFRALDDRQTRELMKKVLHINSREEIRNFVEGLGEKKK